MPPLRRLGSSPCVVFEGCLVFSASLQPQWLLCSFPGVCFLILGTPYIGMRCTCDSSLGSVSMVDSLNFFWLPLCVISSIKKGPVYMSKILLKEEQGLPLQLSVGLGIATLGFRTELVFAKTEQLDIQGWLLGRKKSGEQVTLLLLLFSFWELLSLARSLSSRLG